MIKSDVSASASPADAGGDRTHSGGWRISIALGVASFLVYLANGREIGSFDTTGNTLLPLAIVRGDGLALDRFRPILATWGAPLPVFVTESFGQVISRHPVGPALIALPLIAPQILWLDRSQPGWDRDPNRMYAECRKMAKRAAAALAAILVVALYRLLIRLGLKQVATLAVVATAFGSSLYSVASQALWQHGPAALALVCSMLLLSPRVPSGPRMLAAGLSTALIVVARPLDLGFALVALVWVAWNHPRRLGWFLPAPTVLGLLLIASNLYQFGTIAGGQNELEMLHRQIHGVGGPWSGDLAAGMAGTLFSPNRGLFIFAPWVAVAIALLPWSGRALRRDSLAAWLSISLIAYLFIYSKYAVWWAGGSFGPRYWTEAFAIFGVLLALGLDWARKHSRPAIWLFAITICMAIAVNVIGAFCYPSTWNFYPTDIDIDHRRLWDWRDTELSRCIDETLFHPPAVRLRGR
jgi:hypothetical protein